VNLTIAKKFSPKGSWVCWELFTAVPFYIKIVLPFMQDLVLKIERSFPRWKKGDKNEVND
jgi:hypothetical protein